MSWRLPVFSLLSAVPQKIIETLRINPDAGSGINLAQQLDRVDSAGSDFDLGAGAGDQRLPVRYRLQQIRTVFNQTIGQQHVRHEIVSKYG